MLEWNELPKRNDFEKKLTYQELIDKGLNLPPENKDVLFCILYNGKKYYQVGKMYKDDFGVMTIKEQKSGQILSISRLFSIKWAEFNEAEFNISQIED